MEWAYIILVNLGSWSRQDIEGVEFEIDLFTLAIEALWTSDEALGSGKLFNASQLYSETPNLIAYINVQARAWMRWTRLHDAEKEDSVVE
jgi:hypothetical protein